MKHINNLKKYKGLLIQLVLRDIKTKYRRSILGLLWTVLNPLLMMIVLTVVFSNVFRNDIENFPVYLLCGQVIFNFFNEATNMAMTSIIYNGELIKKVYVPKYIFPLSKLLSSAVNLAASIIALFIVMLFTRTPLQATIFLGVIPLVYVFIFAMGVGLILASYAVAFRDLLHLYSVVTTAWMYLTPLFYPISMLPEWLQIFIKLNPLTGFITTFRGYVMNGVLPSWQSQIYSIGVSILILLLGMYVFAKKQDKFILKL